MNSNMKPTQGMTEPLMDLLYAAPETVVFLVQDAIRAVAVGDWMLASRLMGFAAETQANVNEWFERAGRASDELAAIAKAVSQS